MVTLLDYYVKKNILKKELDEDDNIYDPKTKWFRNHTESEQDKIMETAKEEWWKKYGEAYMNSVYNDEVIAAKELGRDISKWFSERVIQNIKPLTNKLLGNYSDAYREQLLTLTKNFIDDTDEDKKEPVELTEEDLDMRLQATKEHLENIKIENGLWEDYYTFLKDERSSNNG